MHNNKSRPIFLNLLEIRLPVGGVVSILHRVSGVVLVTLIPFALYLLERSLDSEDGFQRVSGILRDPLVKMLGIAGIWFFAHHFLAGVRHLFLDLDVGIGREAARFSAWTVLLLGLLAVAGGIAWLW